MLTITLRRKRRLCDQLLTDTDATIGFVDVGSGGPLKRPWNLLPATRLRRFDFEPTQAHDGGLPLCVSNQTGKASFFVARDERASSFHRASESFAQRFGMPSLFAARTIEVERVTLDGCFAGRFASIDALDVNVEGHDLQVLQGGIGLLEHGSIKLLKVEFETAAVWEGQGWLSDIDGLLRARGYTLAAIELERARPANARHCFHPGEPIWGKALYAAGPERWRSMLEALRSNPHSLAQAVAVAVALYVAADVPGRAFDVLDLAVQLGGATELDPIRIKASIGCAYRWGRLEHGVNSLTGLLSRAVGIGGAASEA